MMIDHEPICEFCGSWETWTVTEAGRVTTTCRKCGHSYDPTMTPEQRAEQRRQQR